MMVLKGLIILCTNYETSRWLFLHLYHFTKLSASLGEISILKCKWYWRYIHLWRCDGVFLNDGKCVNKILLLIFLSDVFLSRSFPWRVVNLNFLCVYSYSAPFISSSSIWSPYSWSVEGTGYEALHYVVFTSLLPLPFTWVQIFSSPPCSQTPSVCVLPSVWETKFHTHTKQRVQL